MIGEGEIVVSFTAGGVVTSGGVYLSGQPDVLLADEHEQTGSSADGLAWYALGGTAFAEPLAAAVRAGVGARVGSPPPSVPKVAAPNVAYSSEAGPPNPANASAVWAALTFS